MNDLTQRNGNTLGQILRMAALNGVHDTVRLHLCRGNNVNATDAKGRTLLMLAASRGHAGLCRFLINAGAYPGLVDHDGNDASAIANANGYADIVALLREYSVPCSEPEPQREISCSSAQTPFMETGDTEAGEEKFDLPVWEEDQDSPPPAADEECVQAASTLQQEISAHAPIDTDEDWTDVEIDLPESQRERRRRGVLDEKFRITSLELILEGLRDGSVPLWRMDEAITDDDDQPYGEFRAHLALVLGQLGIIIDEEPLEWRSVASDGDTWDINAENERLADEALSFLDSLASNDSDPNRIYFKDIRSLCYRHPLSHEEEIGLGKEMEAELDAAVAAIAGSAAAISEILQVGKAIECGEVRREIEAQHGNAAIPETIAERLAISPGKVERALRVVNQQLVTLDSVLQMEGTEELLVDPSPQPEEQAMQTSLRKILDDLLDGFKAREAEVLRLRFGFHDDTEHTLEEIGQMFDVTRERIRQIEWKALKTLAHPARVDKLDCFIEVRKPVGAKPSENNP